MVKGGSFIIPSYSPPFLLLLAARCSRSSLSLARRLDCQSVITRPTTGAAGGMVQRRATVAAPPALPHPRTAVPATPPTSSSQHTTGRAGTLPAPARRLRQRTVDLRPPPPAAACSQSHHTHTHTRPAHLAYVCKYVNQVHHSHHNQTISGPRGPQLPHGPGWAPLRLGRA